MEFTDHARAFVIGCKNVIVIKNHKPLINIFDHRDLGTTENPRVKNWVTKKLWCQFTMKYCLGKWRFSADALSEFLTV